MARSPALPVPLLLLLLLLLAGPAGGADLPPAGAAPPSPSPAPVLDVAPRRLRAGRATGPAPRIDGRLDEPAWEGAEPALAFVQREPRDGLPASEPTEARVLVDGEALYVGILARDREPERVIARLTRRDRDSQSDSVAIELDPRLDRRSGYRFEVSAAGVQRDARLADDTAVDWIWDGSWEGAAVRRPDGWSAELRIPLWLLHPGDSGEWGVNFLRRIARRGEVDTWAALPRRAPGWVSRFGRLEGLEGIGAPPRLGLTPYALARLTAAPGERSGSAGAGLDLRLPLAPAWSLGAAVNPDFGQVEADPAVLNLGVFETFFPEKRPFFLDPGDLFRTPYTLFFSRRIGARPPPPALAPGERLEERPDATTILAAASLTGATRSGRRLALLSAWTADEHATVRRPDGSRIAPRVAGMAHALALRAQERLGEASRAGLLLTARHRRGERPVWSGGLDWDLRWSAERWVLDGQAALSRAPEEGARATGGALTATLRRAGGEPLVGGLELDGRSPDFSLRELGFLSRSDQLSAVAWLTWQHLSPFWGLRQAALTVTADRGWTWHGLPLRRGLQATADLELDNLLLIGAGVARAGAALDDLDTRGGPAILRPCGWDAWGYVTTSPARTAWLGLDLAVGGDAAGSERLATGAELGLHPGPRAELRLRLGLSRGEDAAQWLESRDQDQDGRLDRFLYGRLHRRTVDLTARASLTFQPGLSLELYLQPFLAVGNYDRLRELVDGRGYRFAAISPDALGQDPDFSAKSLQSNLVLRWEYRARGTLFLVWSQSRFDDRNPGDLRLGRDLGDLLAAPATHILFVRLEHRLGP